MQIETARLILKPWKVEYAEELYELAKDPRVGPICGWNPHTSVDNSKEIIDRCLSKDNVFAVVLKESGLIIGSCGIEPTRAKQASEGDLEIGYWIGHSYWGNGYATEVADALIKYGFETLNVNRIWCCYFDGNNRSSRVQEKAGFIHLYDEKVYWERLDKEILLHFSYIDRFNWSK